MDPLNDPGDSDGFGAFVTPREDPPISMAVEEDTENMDIIEDDDDDNGSVPNSPQPPPQLGSASVSPAKVFVSALGSPVSVKAAESRISLAPSVEWLDAYSEILSDPNDIMIMEEDVDGAPRVEESQLTR